MRRTVAAAAGLAVVVSGSWMLHAATTRTGPATAAVLTSPAASSDASPDAALAARQAKAMMTASGTATWVRAPGKEAMELLFPGEPGLLGDGQPAVDAGEVIVVFTDQHVVADGMMTGPPRSDHPSARAASSIIDATTGRSIMGATWPWGGGSTDGRDDSRAVDPVWQWRQAMQRLGHVSTIQVDR